MKKILIYLATFFTIAIPATLIFIYVDQIGWFIGFLVLCFALLLIIPAILRNRKRIKSQKK